MKILFSILVITISLTFFSSCYYDKEELLYGSGNVPCTDTIGAVSYAQKVAPMFQQYCYSCHNSSFPSGFSPMPQGMGKMNSCQVALIKKWIDSGMQNN
jgi:hypothetical protein